MEKLNYKDALIKTINAALNTACYINEQETIDELRSVLNNIQKRESETSETSEIDSAILSMTKTREIVFKYTIILDDHSFDAKVILETLEKLVRRTARGVIYAGDDRDWLLVSSLVKLDVISASPECWWCTKGKNFDVFLNRLRDRLTYLTCT